MSIAQIQLETERLILRVPRSEDFDRYAELFAHESSRGIGGPHPRGDAWRRFLQMPGAWLLQGFAMFSVIEKSSGRWVGQAGPWRPDGWPGTEVGYAFHHDARGRGYCTEACAAAMDWAFETLDWHEVIHCISPENRASQNVARRLGSRERGPATLPPPLDAHAIVIWGQTREQWRAPRGGLAVIALYGMSVSGNCHKARLLCEQLGRAYRWVEIDSAHGETRTPAYLAKNPNGKVPMLELDDGRILVESNAILCYLADGTPWLPEDAWQRAQALSWMFFEQYSHEPYIAVARFIRGWTPLDSPRRAELPALRERGDRALAVMERHLQTHPWFTGERYGVADIALFAYTAVAGHGGFDMAQYPAIQAWLARVAATPGFVPMPPPPPEALARIDASF